jgi:hypothetical protein
MKTDTQEIYETPELHELGQAEDLTLGLDQGSVPDWRGNYRHFIQEPVINEAE